MRWMVPASGSLLLAAACSSKTRPRVACRRTAALSQLLYSRARYGDSLHIHPFHPREEGESESGWWRDPQLRLILGIQWKLRK